MKVIKPDIDAHTRRAQFRHDRANQQLEDLCNNEKELPERSSSDGSIRNTAIESLENIMEELQPRPIRTREEVREVTRALNNWKAIQEEARHSQISESRFHLFPKLPQELQLKIWEFAARAEKEPKVHCIDISTNGPFFSNQGLPPLTRASSPSRSVYLAQTGREPAFSTYVNFQTDIIYARRFEQMPHERTDLGNLDDYDLFGPEDYTDRLERFLGCKNADKIQRLAVTCDFFCQTRYFDINSTWELHLNMKSRMPLWREFVFVFHDDRFGTWAWRDAGASFKDMTAREKRRKWVDVKVRYDIRTLYEMSREHETMLSLPRVGFSLVCVEGDKCEEARRIFGITAERGS